jgi:hypothetical protein
MSEMTATEAAALVEADRQRRIKAAAEAVQAALAEHGCGLSAQIVVSADGRLDAQILIVPR